MTDAFYKLPTLLILGLLVVIFYTLDQQKRLPRFRLWFLAWILIFVRFFLDTVALRLGVPVSVAVMINLAILQVVGILLLTSVSAVFHQRRLRLPLFLTLSVPTLTLTIFWSLGFSLPVLYSACVLVVTCGAIGWTLYEHQGRLTAFFWILLSVVTGGGVMVAIRTWQGRTDIGFYGIQTAVYAAAGVFFYLTFRRFTPGVISSSLGFLVWAGASPALYALASHGELLRLANEFFEIPKFFVAFGMIVTVLEEESIVIGAGRERERTFRIQLQKFGDVTSRLLSGVEVRSYCQHIAGVVTEASNFQRAAILLIDDEQRVYLAGQSGVSETSLQEIHESIHRVTAESVAALCRPEKRMGLKSFRVSFHELAGITGPPSVRDELAVPLYSSHAAVLGCILLAAPRSGDAGTEEDVSALEMLGTDLAVALENSNLQRQLIRSEKLAGVGQLVSGVAHELNNPLTAVLGYAEMLQERIKEEEIKRDLDVIRREALRMKKIIDNLLRFARQGKSERRPVDLASIVDDVLKLRAYELRSKKIDLQLDIPADLPKIVVDENLMKQVFINVLNNAFEAVDGLPEKKLKISASSMGEKINIRVSDNGPGFPNLHRVFDPFFTTKGLGKGPGLGLSICYGIVKEHGGEIAATNLVPNGACIVMDIPAAVAKAERESPASVVH